MLLALTTCAHQGTIGHHSTFLYVIVKNVLMMSSKCLQLPVFRIYKEEWLWHTTREGEEGGHVLRKGDSVMYWHRQFIEV